MPDFLPAKYEYSHNYALFLNDILSDFVKTGEQAGIFVTEIVLKDEDHGEALDKTPDDQKWEWLEANGYGDMTADVIYRQVTVALLADLSHFVFEALNSSKKGKLTVAYSLLRKPFKDNLFYLEWLLADHDDFVNAFTHGGPDALENRRNHRATRFPIINEAIKRTRQPAMFDADFIDEIRYDRQAAHGFAGTWDQANHLITTFAAIRTSRQGFNFIFSTNQREEHWEFLYTKLPMLLYYAVDVVEAVIARLVPDPALIDDTNRQRRSLGYKLWLDSLGFEELAGEEEKTELPDCPNCGVPVLLDIDNMKLFVQRLTMKCQKCGAELDASSESGEESE